MKNQNSNTRVGSRLRQLIAGVTTPHGDLPGTHKEFEGTKKQLLEYLGSAKPASDIDALYFSALRLVASVDPKGVVTKKGKPAFLQEVSNHLAFVLAFVGTHCEESDVNGLLDLMLVDPPVKYEDLDLGFEPAALVALAQQAVTQFCQPYKQLLDLKAKEVPGIDAPMAEVKERYDAFVAQESFNLAGDQALLIVTDDEGEGEGTQTVADMIRSELLAHIVEQAREAGASAVIPGSKAPETAKPKVAKQAAPAPAPAPAAAEPEAPADAPVETAPAPAAEAPAEEPPAAEAPAEAPAPVNPPPAAAPVPAETAPATAEAPATAPAPVPPAAGDTPVAAGVPAPVTPVPTAPAPTAPVPTGPATA